MPCLIAWLFFYCPRLLIIILYFYGYISRAYKTTIWLVLGFIFMPITTIVYAFLENDFGSKPWSTTHTIIIIIAVVLDFGLYSNATIRTKAKDNKH